MVHGIHINPSSALRTSCDVTCIALLVCFGDVTCLYSYTVRIPIWKKMPQCLRFATGLFETVRGMKVVCYSTLSETVRGRKVLCYSTLFETFSWEKSRTIRTTYLVGSNLNRHYVCATLKKYSGPILCRANNVKGREPLIQTRLAIESISPALLLQWRVHWAYSRSAYSSGGKWLSHSVYSAFSRSAYSLCVFC